MAFSTQQLFLLFLILLPITTHGMESLYHECGKNFTQNEILESNIDNFLLVVVAKTSLHGYAISSYGNGCDTVYGVTRCQGDLSLEACSTCITSAAQNIRKLCSDVTGSRIWDETCFLRYDTDNFIGKVDTSYANVWYSTTPSKDPNEFTQALGGLMGEVMANAARGVQKFGWGKTIVNSNLTIYGMAQCTRDLNEYACNECLETALQTMSNECKTQEGCRIFGTSCMIRYETYKFLSIDSPIENGAAAPSYY